MEINNSFELKIKLNIPYLLYYFSIFSKDKKYTLEKCHPYIIYGIKTRLQFYIFQKINRNIRIFLRIKNEENKLYLFSSFYEDSKYLNGKISREDVKNKINFIIYNNLEYIFITSINNIPNLNNKHILNKLEINKDYFPCISSIDSSNKDKNIYIRPIYSNNFISLKNMKYSIFVLIDEISGKNL
uniref:Uncharacterized protein n=1 Tax=Pithovirus LCPAC104 TaxID=2506589 RepID=A0A481Z416_9VIRU|nr:MAG: hypothetical protein LCPAC104_01450 [Pithovirus LCPAC104]